jgi:hypothetical protein
MYSKWMGTKWDNGKCTVRGCERKGTAEGCKRMRTKRDSMEGKRDSGRMQGDGWKKGQVEACKRIEGRDSGKM